MQADSCKFPQHHFCVIFLQLLGLFSPAEYHLFSWLLLRSEWRSHSPRMDILLPGGFFCHWYTKFVGRNSCLPDLHVSWLSGLHRLHASAARGGAVFIPKLPLSTKFWLFSYILQDFFGVLLLCSPWPWRGPWAHADHSISSSRFNGLRVHESLKEKKISKHLQFLHQSNMNPYWEGLQGRNCQNGSICKYTYFCSLLLPS